MLAGYLPSLNLKGAMWESDGTEPCQTIAVGPRAISIKQHAKYLTYAEPNSDHKAPCQNNVRNG